MPDISPSRPSIRPWALLAVAALLAALVAIAPAPAAATGGVDVRILTIEADDGTRIPAIVTEPTAPGPHPVIVMPASWAVPSLQYIVPAASWAERGFVVISYTSRGFWGSDGEIDIAGDLTVGDVTTVIDWAVANAEGDPDRVGTVGISYGAGIGLLAAAHDDRIDAVVAMSGWYDLEASLYPNETISQAAAETLTGAGATTGRPGPLLQAIADELAVGDATTALAAAPSRSAVNDLATLHANGTAILFAHGWNDGIFPPSQTIDMYERFQGPKKLMLAPGDHATAEGLGLIDLPNDVWSEALRWVERHVAGLDVDTGAEVTAVANDTRRTFTANSWDTLTNADRQYFLSEPRRIWWSPETGRLTDRSSRWTHRIDGGRNTHAESGLPLVTGTLNQFLGLPPLVATGLVDRSHGAVWQGPRSWHPHTMIGTPELSVTLEPGSEDTTVFVYLYEENLLGVGSLITHKAFTLRDATPGTDVVVDIELEPTVWEMAAGSRLTLVIDTVDARYRTETGSERVEFASSHAHAATLRVPTG